MIKGYHYRDFREEFQAKALDFIVRFNNMLHYSNLIIIIIKTQELETGKVYRHFKGDYYLPIGTAKFHQLTPKSNITKVKNQLNAHFFWDRIKYSEDGENNCEFIIAQTNRGFEIIADENNPELPKDKKLNYSATYVIYIALYILQKKR